MSSHIKSFESFSSGKSQKDSLLEFDAGSLLTGAVNFFGPGLGSAVEQKLVEFLLNKLGIKPDTAASMLIQEVVEAIPMEDYPSILTGEKLNMAYLNPYLAEAIVDSVKRTGLDTIFNPLAEKFGLEPGGLLTRTIVESFEALGEDELKKSIISILNFIAGIEFNAGEYASTLDSETQEKLSKGIGKALSMQSPLAIKRANELKAKAKAETGGESNWFSTLVGSLSKPSKMTDTF
jgi:hypothetical protein